MTKLTKLYNTFENICSKLCFDYTVIKVDKQDVMPLASWGAEVASGVVQCVRWHTCNFWEGYWNEK